MSGAKKGIIQRIFPPNRTIRDTVLTKLNHTLKSHWHYLPSILCLLIMLPRLVSPQFGLFDDARSLKVAESIAAGNWDLSWEVQAGRFRPLVWITFAFWYILSSGKPFWFFVGNWIFFTGSTISIIFLVRLLGGSKFQAFISGLIFALSGPIIENVYTLTKGENLQLFLIAFGISSAVYLIRENRRKFALLASVGLFTAACLTKETTLLLIPISLLWWIIAKIGRKNSEKDGVFTIHVSQTLVLSSLIAGGILYFGRAVFVSPQLTGVGYTSNFIFDIGHIKNSIIRWGGWLLRDYVWLTPLIFAAFISYLNAKKWCAIGLCWYAGAWMALWLAIYLPWYSAAEYYLLPFAAGAAIFAGELVVPNWTLVHHPVRLWRLVSIALLVCSVLLLLVAQANSITSGIIQLSQDAANSSVLEFISKNAPSGSAIIVNIQLANEYVEQMQIMFADYYDRPDLYVTHYQAQDLKQLVSQFPEIFLLIPEVMDQPSMTVRMGIIEESQVKWNKDLMSRVEPRSWQMVYRTGQTYTLVTVDYPYLLCPIIFRENFCNETQGLVNLHRFHYQWEVYQSQK